MKRKEFITVCGRGCLGLLGVSILNQSCAGTHYAQGLVNGNQLVVATSEFEELHKGQTRYRKHIIVKAEQLEQPLIVYRGVGPVYTALLLRCTHQGLELSVNGDILTCPAHGSEFSNRGAVIQGPAEQVLRAYNVMVHENKLYIQLG